MKLGVLIDFFSCLSVVWARRSEGLQTVRVLAPIPKQAMQWTPGFPTPVQSLCMIFKSLLICPHLLAATYKLFFFFCVCYRNGGAITLHWFQSWPSAAARVSLKAK